MFQLSYHSNAKTTMTVHELTRRRRSVSFWTSWLSPTLESLSRSSSCAQAARRSVDGVVAVYRQSFRPLCGCKSDISTVIPRLTKIIRSAIIFVSRNVISPPLCDVVSSFLWHTHRDGKDKLLEWPDRSCLLLYVSACIH